MMRTWKILKFALMMPKDDCPACGALGSIIVPAEFRRDYEGRLRGKRGKSHCRTCGSGVSYDFRKALEEQCDSPMDWETRCWVCDSEVEVIRDEFDSSLLTWIDPGKPPLRSTLMRHAYCETCEEGRTMMPKDLLNRARTMAHRT